MPDLSRHQKKIIERYYDHRDDIALARLGDIVSELYLADSQRKRDQLWKRAEKAMIALKIKDTLRKNILQRRDPEALARQLREWSAQGSKPK